MSGWLIAFYKQPGMRPFGFRETWIHIFAKLVLKVTGLEATMACQDDQLCAGLKERLDGAFHGIQAIWDKRSTTEDWWFLLVGAKNVFNNINWFGILWTVQHLWPPGARFFFNYYCPWSLLVLNNRNGAANFLHSREGVTQGEPLTMIDLGMGILQLIKNLKQ